MNRIILLLFVSQVALLSASPIEQEKLIEHLWNQTKIVDEEKFNLVGGDVAVPKKKSRSFGLSTRRNNWPNGLVPYTIDSRSGFTKNHINIIKAGMQMITDKTDGCIRFTPRTNQRNYVNFVHGQGCWSNLGMIGGRQPINLQRDGCVVEGTVVHEIMHALGFWHEQSRPDRDQYITVNYNNVDPASKSNFDKQQGQTFGTRYDPLSIMQYGERAFSINGGKTMVSKDRSITLTEPYQKKGSKILTKNDIASVKQLYSCSGSGNNGGDDGGDYGDDYGGDFDWDFIWNFFG